MTDEEKPTPVACPDDLTSRFKEQFSSVYLTLVSIIQASVLGYMMVFIHDPRTELTLRTVVLLLCSFLMLVAMWNEYAMGSMAFRWAPGLADAALPFALGSFEFLAVRNAGSVFWWCVCSVGFVFAAVLSYVNQYRSAARHPENAALLQRLSRMRRLNILLMVIGGVWYAGLALIARGSARAQDIAAFGTLVPLVVFLIRSPFNRRAILGGKSTSPVSGDNKDAAR